MQIKTLAVLCASIGLGCSLVGNQCYCQSPQAQKPNILVILVDDMGYGDPGCFNQQSKIPTPNIDQLAAAGMRFSDAHAPGPLCHLSRYGLITGRYPFRTKIQWNRGPVIKDSDNTIASLLKSNGYATSMVGKWHLGFNEQGYDNPMSGGPIDCGFDSFFGIRASTDIPPYFYIRGNRAVDPPTLPIDAKSTPGWSPIQGEFWRSGKIAPNLELKDVLPRFTDEAISVIEQHATERADQPFMLYLAYPAPHTPWLPSPEYSGRSGAGLYGDFVVMVDDMIGRVLKTLDNNKLADSTMVVFTSDNGPVWYQRDVKRFGHDSSGGFRGMKADAWEAGHRMPFVVRWPEKVAKGSNSDQLVSFTDLYATFAEMLNVELPADAAPDSFSFLPTLLANPADPKKRRSSLVMASGNRMMTIRSGDWKLIEGLGSGGFSKPGRIKPESGQVDGQLYNLKSDPAETSNRFEELPAVVAKLREELHSVQNSPAHRNINRNLNQKTNLPRVDRPNVVLVMSDDQGWGQTGYNNHPILKTPNLNAMAANGLRFDRFYSAGPVCSPTRASVLTGRSHRRTGVEQHGYALRRQEKSIAELLRDLGYATGHFGKWHLNGLRGPGVPIFENDSHHPGTFGFDRWFSVSNFFDLNPVLSRQGNFEEFKGDSSEVIVANAAEFMREQQRQGKPFFVVIWFGTPHAPFMASDEDMKGLDDLDERTRKQLGELIAMDRSIGTLRSALKQMKVADNTLVWFSSDNGGLNKMKPQTVGGLRGYKGSLYEGGIRVPAIVEWPARIKPRVTQFPAVSMDILATVADIVNIPQSDLTQPQDGASLLSLFDKELKRRDKPIPFAYQSNRALIDNEYKLLRIVNKKQSTERYELFDLNQDRREQNNLFESLPDVADRLQQQLTAFAHSMNRSIEGADYPEGKVNPGEPKPRHWKDDPRYQPYLEQWKQRPEYRSYLNRQ